MSERNRVLSSTLGGERPLTAEEASGLRSLLFGPGPARGLGRGWTQQGFAFRAHPPYGLRQRASGPCGLLAAVQATLVRDLLFGYERALPEPDGALRPEPAHCEAALVRALADILWRAGRGRLAVLAREGGGDGDPLQRLRLASFASPDALAYQLQLRLPELRRAGGCVLFLYSLLLSRGLDRVRAEMDSLGAGHLIGEDQFCSQEVVNLALTGRAVTNVFDGDLEVDTGGERPSLFRGLCGRSRVGLLSASGDVGSFFRDPADPVWVLFGEQHYSVLFASARARRPRRLFHYDGLGPRAGERRFLLRFGAGPPDEADSPLRRCVRTRWPDARLRELPAEVTR